MDLDLNQLELTPEEIAELMEPYGPKQAMIATRIGFAMGLSELGLSPSEFEYIAKQASFDLARFLPQIPEAYGTAAMMAIGGAGLAGAYSGYARHRIDQMLQGNDDPDVQALRKKIDAYHNLTSDLKRTNGISNLPAAR